MTGNGNFDPWDSANNPTLPGGNYWGQVKLDVWVCALVKGQGKVPYDPNQHEQVNTAIDLSIIPISEQKVNNPRATERSLIAESKEWTNITLASLRELGVSDLRNIRDKWAHVITKGTGRTYEKDGETREQTQFWFVEIFDSQQACVESYMAANHNGNNGSKASGEQSAPPVENGNTEKKTAYNFLKVIVANACRGQSDLELIRKTIATNIANYPIVTKYFTVDSPETVELMMAEMARK